MANENVVYHGSPVGGLTEIKPNSTKQGIKVAYAAYEKAAAMTYMFRRYGDLDTSIFVRNGTFTLVERRKNVLNELYDRGGYLYELPADKFLSKSENKSFNSFKLCSFETVSTEVVPVLNETYYENILEALNEEEKNGHIKIYRYPDRPQNMPLDNSDLINKNIGRWINTYKRNGTLKVNRELKLFFEIYPELAEKVKERFKQHGIDTLFMHSINLRQLTEHLKAKKEFDGISFSDYGLGFIVRKNSIPNVDFDTVVYIPANVRDDTKNDMSLVIPSDIQEKNNVRDIGGKNIAVNFLHKLTSKIKESKEIPDSIMIYPIISNIAEPRTIEQTKTPESSDLSTSSELARKTGDIITFLKKKLQNYGITTSLKVDIKALNTDEFFKSKQNLEI